MQCHCTDLLCCPEESPPRLLCTVLKIMTCDIFIIFPHSCQSVINIINHGIIDVIINGIINCIINGRNRRQRWLLVVGGTVGGGVFLTETEGVSVT